MELWQMDVMGRVHLTDGQEVKIVTGIDDHSRFVICAKVVLRATGRSARRWPRRCAGTAFPPRSSRTFKMGDVSGMARVVRPVV
jgi:hypothetical protein